MSLIILPLFMALSTFSTSSAQAGIMVFVTAIMAAYIMSMVSPWLSIILIIVYIGGMLVVLSYLMAISPKKTEPSKLSLSILASIPIFMVLSNPYFESLNSSVMQMSDIYSKESLWMFIVAGVFLLLTMVSIVKTVERKGGALRPLKK